MTNLEKMLEALLRFQGDKLVIALSEPPYILTGISKKYLSKQTITSREIGVLANEFKNVFDRSPRFLFKDKKFLATASDSALEFLVKKESGEEKIDMGGGLSMKETAPAPPPSTPAPPPPPPPPAPKAEPEIVPDESVEFHKQLQSAKKEIMSESPSIKTEVRQTIKPDINGSTNGFSILKMFHMMIEKGASDMHLSGGCTPIMRIDGEMVVLDDLPSLDDEIMMGELKRITPDINLREFEETNDTDYAYEVDGLARFRANIFMDHRGIGAVFRQIPSKILSAEVLKVPESVLKLCELPKGLILVTGPTGSGKSTTLAAMIDYINIKYKKHIITIEDPVEFVHPNKSCLINQREISTHTQSFKAALRAALREDPDIILVGEMRDLETIAIAIEMAVTGHLVFGTLHTNTAVGTVDRIIDQFPADQQEQIRTMLGDALVGVVAQMLCKKKGGGRVAAYEILIVTMAMANLIREGKTFQLPSMMQAGKGLGMKLMNNSFLEFVKDGQVEIEEAISKAADQDGLKSLLKQSGFM